MKRTKFINNSRIMREIWLQRETSRVEIARNLGLDKSTISLAVNDLIEKGVIVETAEGNSGPQGGRKPVIIKLNKTYGCVLGVEFRPGSYTAVLVDMEGEVQSNRIGRFETHGESLATILVATLQSLVYELEASKIHLLGIGVGISGVVNAQEGIIKYSEPLGITTDFDFHEEVAQQFDIPVFVDNDANACVWGELAFHRRKELRDFIFLLLEFRDFNPLKDAVCNRISIGIGLVINGNVHYGHQYSAGEFRSLFRTKESVGQLSLTEDDHRKVLEDATVMERFLRELFANVGLIVNTLNLSHIILGGAFEELGDHTKDILEEEIIKNWPYPYPYDVKQHIWYSSFGERAVAYGAAGMVLNTLFGDMEVMEGRNHTINLRSNLMVF
ncbi:MAG: ROK family protein [Sphaerochaetaceae bacterium]